ncbi:MAG: hypothetical protein ACYC1I_05695 [Acidimicrobiales bacterium]
MSDLNTFTPGSETGATVGGDVPNGRKDSQPPGHELNFKDEVIGLALTPSTCLFNRGTSRDDTAFVAVGTGLRDGDLVTMAPASNAKFSEFTNAGSSPAAPFSIQHQSSLRAHEYHNSKKGRLSDC